MGLRICIRIRPHGVKYTGGGSWVMRGKITAQINLVPVGMFHIMRSKGKKGRLESNGHSSHQMIGYDHILIIL